LGGKLLDKEHVVCSGCGAEWWDVYDEDDFIVGIYDVLRPIKYIGKDFPIYLQVIEDIHERAKAGKDHYGEHLTTETLVEGLQEAYEEAIDQAIYLKLALMRMEYGDN